MTTRIMDLGVLTQTMNKVNMEALGDPYVITYNQIRHSNFFTLFFLEYMVL